MPLREQRPLKKMESQSGNMLFLILIAVVLFAALSYAVMKSTRSGSGSGEKEKNLLSSAQITQYPTMLRSAVMRMIVAGVPVENLKFDAPGTGGYNAASVETLVFNAGGGGASYQIAPRNLSEMGDQMEWRYNANFDVPGIGTDGAGGNDVIAFLPGLSSGVCLQANEKIRIDTTGCTYSSGASVPNISGINTAIDQQMVATPAYTLPTGDQPDLAPAGCANAFLKQATGCFYDVTGARYVFYSVLLER